MDRSKNTVWAFVVFVFCALVVASCSGGEEQGLLRTYFMAARVNDTSSLNNIAMVVPEGVVRNFSIENVTEEQRSALRVREMDQTLRDARAAEEEFTARKQVYQNENFEAITRVLDAEGEDEEVANQDSEVQEAWTTWREETMEHARTVSDLQVELNGAQSVASLSVFDPQNPVDLTQFEGELVSKEVTVEASVTTEDGTEVDQTLIITMQRAELMGGDGAAITGRWVISSLSQQ